MTQDATRGRSVGSMGLDDLVQQATSAGQQLELVERLIAGHIERVHRTGLLLYAGCNELSPAAERVLASGLGSLPAMGRPGAKDQPGTAEISALEILVERQLTHLFGGSYAEARLPSCTLANAALYALFAGPGGKIAALGSGAGAHVSSQASGTPVFLGLNVVELPFDARQQDIDAEGAMAVITAERPALVILGSSITLRALSVDRIAACCRRHGAILVADVAHTAGLIAGARLPNPLEQGADFITGSTYKSLAGPPGGFIVAQDPQHEAALRRIVCPVLTSNYDAARLAAIAISLAEARVHMGSYASAMIENAKILAHECGTRGLDAVAVPGNPTPTHQVMLRVGDRNRAQTLMHDAEGAGIFVGMNSVPGAGDQSGLRIGTQVLTRRGMGAAQMSNVAELLSDLVHGRNRDTLGDRVRSLALQFTKIHYC